MCGGKDGSAGLPDRMKLNRPFFSTLTVCLCASALHAADITGGVVDPAGRPVPGARVAAVNTVGVITQQITDDEGRFSIYVSPLYENVQLRVTAQGFETATATLNAPVIRLHLAPQSESIRVTASALDIPASEQGSSVSVITSRELRDRNEAQAVDLMRQLPGMIVSQSGPRGSLTDLFVRGGDSKYNLVLLDGIPINSFYFGGLFDFAHVPSDAIQEIGIARGPQSAIYGSYAMGSVVNFTTRSPEDGAALDVVAEGGTHEENRFAISGSGKPFRDFGLAGSLSSLLTNGPVPNSDYRDQNAFLSLSHRWLTQNLFAFGAFNSNDVGQPGAFGSNPVGNFFGLDTVSRNRNNTSTYGAHWQDGLTENLRVDLMLGFFLNNSYFVSGYGDSFNKDLRADGELRATYAASPHWIAAVGYSFTREEMKNTFVTDSSFRSFPLRRDIQGVYWENRITLGRLFLNVGAREELYQNPFQPGDAFGFPPRPDFPATTTQKFSPKIAGAYRLSSTRRLHASYGTGIRPPGGGDLAFTTNPHLLPERLESYDGGIEQRFLRDRASIDVAYFNNRYRDLLVSLGGSLARLSNYTTDNVANAKAQGMEVSSQLRPASWLSISGNYTWLQSKVLSLDGGSGLAQAYFYVGQPLVRRPKHSGGVVVTAHYKRLDANLTGSFRGHTLDVEPNFGASGGLFRNTGYQNVGVNINYRVRGNFSVYGNLRNALDQRYEEIYGFPSPLLNVVAGVKWSLNRAR